MSDLAVFLLCLAWLVLTWLCLAFVTVPITLVTISAGLCYGAVLTTIGYLQVFTGTEDHRILAGPDPGAARRLRSPYPRWDDGWPGYLSWQVERDLLAAAGWPGRQAGQLWGQALALARPLLAPLATALALLPAPVGFLVGVTVGTYCGWLAYAVVVEAVTAIPRCARLSAIGGLRAFDSSIRWWHGAGVTCPSCRHVAWLPAYRCDKTGCETIHRDLRPGRLGVWWRRCQCGEPLPTTVRRAAPVLTPVCANCDCVLPRWAGIAPDARIALSGSSGAGKTQLLTWAAAEMAGSDSAPWQPADDYTATWLRDAMALLDEWPEKRPDPTVDPGLLTFSRSVAARQFYFHVADIDGHLFETDQHSLDLWQLGATRRHLLVLDAMMIPSVRDRFGSSAQAFPRAGGSPADLAWAETSVALAELPYRLLVEELNGLGARTRRCSLAVVISKADQLAAHGVAPGTDPAGVPDGGLKAWLRKQELHNLVDASERDFARVRYFLAGDGWEDPAAPFEWLLSCYSRGATRPLWSVNGPESCPPAISSPGYGWAASSCCFS